MIHKIGGAPDAIYWELTPMQGPPEGGVQLEGSEPNGDGFCVAVMSGDKMDIWTGTLKIMGLKLFVDGKELNLP